MDPALPADPPIGVVPAPASDSPTLYRPVEPAVGPVEPVEAAGSPPPTKPRRTRWFWIVIVLLALAGIGTGIYLYVALTELEEANSRIIDQNREIKEQGELIDRKETFGAAMTGLLESAAKFEGVLVGDIVPTERFETVAAQAWAHRWDAAKLDDDILEVEATTQELETMLSEAAAEAATNSSGNAYEAAIDSLGRGFVASILDDADSQCGRDVIACVSSDDARLVHFDIGDNGLPYMTDRLRIGVAYHEFAHVLQFTHWEETEVALESFGGDAETMADCFALTYLDGWTLDHTIWINRYEYWDVSLGYGHTCDATQAQVIRDWYEKLGYSPAPVSQGD